MNKIDDETADETNAEDVMRDLDRLHSEFKNFSDAQVGYFERELTLRAYVRGAPPDTFAVLHLNGSRR